MAKNKEEDKGQPVSATQWEQRQFPVTFQEKERERPQINKMKNVKEDTVTDTKETGRFVRDYYE